MSDKAADHGTRGERLAGEGKIDEAIEAFRQAVSIDPQFAAAYYNLGVLLRMQGQLDEAVGSYQKALVLTPDFAEAHYHLGNALQELEKFEDAVVSYHKALVLKPEFAEAHCSLGIAHQERGRLDDAAASYKRAIAIKPDNAWAHHNLGNVHQNLGRLDEAVASYKRALAIKPDYAEAHSNLGSAFLDLGRLEDAVASCRKALAIEPEYVGAYRNLSSALLDLGAMDEAIAICRKALALKPDYAEVHGNLAEALEKTNRTEDLREAVAVAKRNCPGHPRLSLSEAQLLYRDGDFEAARAVLETTGGVIDDARFMGERAHLLGKLCDRLDDTDAAFNYFREGNLRCGDNPVAKVADAKRYLARVDVLARRFTADWIADWKNLEKSGDDRPDPVFLVGFPRSGTTLLDTILRSHPAISVVEESPAIRNMRDALGRFSGGHPDGLAGIDPADLVELRQIYFAELDQHLEQEDRSAVVIDKMPLNTVEAGLIHRIFPAARFLFVQRHPCDCVLSCFMQNFYPNDAMLNFLDLEDAARLYDKVMTLWQQYQAVLPLEVYTVRYESLIEAIEETLTPLLDFLGVDWDDGVRNYADTAYSRGKISTASYNQVTQPLYTRARGRWQRYREQMQPVLPTLLPWVSRFGYGE
jgi:tetratricopeptide (TPR) repeat protein